MARTLAQIIAAYDDAQAAEAALSGLNSPSQTAIYTMLKYVYSVCTLFSEQLQDLKKTEIEDIVASAAVGSEAWIQSKAFEFQYDSVVPQYLDIVNFAPQYDPVDVTKRIVTRAAVYTTLSYTVFVKLAKSEPPVKLSAPELAAFQAYLNGGGDGTYSGRSRGIGGAGLNMIAASYDSDKLYLAGTIYYNGQYSTTVKQLVIDAIDLYLKNLSSVNNFGVSDGSVTLLGITDAIQSVRPAIIDISLDDVAVRADLTAFGSKTFMRQAKTDIITEYRTYAGYIEQETTASNTWADKLIFVAK